MPNAKFRLLPEGKYVMIKLTAEGKQNETAIPAKARNRISCMLVFDRPQASVQTLCMNVPIRYMFRAPTTSATAPDRMSVQPQVKE